MYYTLIATCYDKIIVLIKTCDKKQAEQEAWEQRETYDHITLISSESGGLNFSVPVFDEVRFEFVNEPTEYERRTRTGPVARE